MKAYMAGTLAVLCVLSVACSKKTKEPAPTEPSMIESAKDQAIDTVAALQEKTEQQMAAVKEQVVSKVEEYKEVVVSATRPLEEIKAEADGLNVDQLKETALKYKDAITAKTAELEPLLTKFKELPMAQKLSGEGLEIKDEIEAVKQSIEALKARYDVYISKLKTMGGADSTAAN